jgi:hypothetical protein
MGNIVLRGYEEYLVVQCSPQVGRHCHKAIEILGN